MPPWGIDRGCWPQSNESLKLSNECQRVPARLSVWQTSEDPSNSVRYHLFDPVPGSMRRAAEVELAAAGTMYFGKSVDVVEVTEMLPLSAYGGRSAMHPLDDRIHRASRRVKQD